MMRKVYRSLDQPSAFFGIRGRFILVMLVGTALVSVPSLVIGMVTTALLGGGVFLLPFPEAEGGAHLLEVQGNRT